MIAAERGRTEICKLLLDGGADLSVADDGSRTALSLAVEGGHPETAQLLAARSSGGQSLGNIRPQAILEGQDDGMATDWEVEEESPLPVGDGAEREKAFQVQTQLSDHHVESQDEDWSDVLIVLPPSRRRTISNSGRERDSVRFRRLRNGRSTSRGLPAPRLEDAIVALDLSRLPDELLNSVTLTQVIRSADTSPELRKCVSRSRLFEMRADEFLADDDGEARFLEVPGLEIEDYLELADLMNAFTILVHQEAGRIHADPEGGPAPGAREPAPHQQALPARTRFRDPELVLACEHACNVVPLRGIFRFED